MEAAEQAAEDKMKADLLKARDAERVLLKTPKPTLKDIINAPKFLKDILKFFNAMGYPMEDNQDPDDKVQERMDDAKVLILRQAITEVILDQMELINDGELSHPREFFDTLKIIYDKAKVQLIEQVRAQINAIPIFGIDTVCVILYLHFMIVSMLNMKRLGAELDEGSKINLLKHLCYSNDSMRETIASIQQTEENKNKALPQPLAAVPFSVIWQAMYDLLQKRLTPSQAMRLRPAMEEQDRTGILYAPIVPNIRQVNSNQQRPTINDAPGYPGNMNSGQYRTPGDRTNANNSSSYNTPICWWCGQTGHTRNNCWKLGDNGGTKVADEDIVDNNNNGQQRNKPNPAQRVVNYVEQSINIYKVIV